MNTFSELLSTLTSDQIQKNSSLLYDVIRMRKQIDELHLRICLIPEPITKRDILDMNLQKMKLQIAYEDYQNLVRLIK